MTFINEAVLTKLSPEGERPLRIENLQEIPTMVTQRIERITQNWLLEGRREGRKEGREEGREEGIRKGQQIGIREGELTMLRRLLEGRFGELSPQAVERLERADVDLLLEWSDRVLTAAKLEDIFKE